MAKAAAKKAPKKPPTKTEVFTNIAESTDLTKKQVAAVFESLEQEIEKALAKKGPRIFVIPNLCKIYVHRKPASKERQQRNPRTGEMMTVAAKPAEDVVKIRVLKNLKEMIQ